MCGITGIFAPKSNKDFEILVKNMTEELTHRGPDSYGYHMDKANGLYFGHRRLRVLDLNQRADQPMFNEDRSVVVVYNGEIYNHTELRKELQSKGHIFTSSSDTEVLVHGYEEYGTGIFNRIDGEYAFAIWDLKLKKVILVRDRLGIKPLYYIFQNGALFFSSEVKSFRNIPPDLWPKELNRNNVTILLGFQYFMDPETTILEGVKKVPAASYLEFLKNEKRLFKYWKLTDTNTHPPYKEAVETTHLLLRDAVKKRILNCDVPQGVLLSGGLDSSTVAAMAADIAGKNRVKTFTAISDAKMDEREFAKTVAKHIGSIHTEVEIKYPKILNSLDKIVSTYDDLNTVDPGIVSVIFLSEQIKKLGITVVLVGEGADEVFGGYSWYGLSKFPFNMVPSHLRSAAYYYILSRCISNPFYYKHFRYLHQNLSKYSGDLFNQITRFELEYQLPNHFNMKVDKGNMSHGVEPRVPYLDYKLVEYIYNLPAEYKLKGRYFNHWKSWEKRILRDVASKYLPEKICGRKKHGFMLSMIDTLNEDKAFVKERIMNNQSVITSFINANYLKWLFLPTSNKILAKEKEFMTWKLLLFSAWYDYYFKKGI